MNVYYQPADLGLEVVGDLNEEDLDYEFNMLVVWRKLDGGSLFWATDSGCSCPAPFEEYHSIESLSPITRQTFGEFERAVHDFPAAPDAKVDLLRKVQVA